MQTYTVEIDDGHGGTATQLVTITINGTNDAAVITGDTTGTVVEAGGVANGTPGTPTADRRPQFHRRRRSGRQLGGDRLPDREHQWLRHVHDHRRRGVELHARQRPMPPCRRCHVGGTLTDTFTVATIDGTEQVVTITITGANDAPVAVADSNAGDAVVESGVNPGDTPFAGDPVGDRQRADQRHRRRQRRQQDRDRGQRLGAQRRSAVVGTYGTLTLAADGTWSYTLDNADPDTDALAQGQTVTDVFTYTVSDANGATSSTSLTITITGTNDAPVAVADGNAGDAVVESGVNPGNTPFAGDPSATGNVLTNDTDVDSGDSKTVTAVNGSALNVGQPLVGTYGTLTLAADGTWSYALNNADPDTDALAQGQTATDVFTYTVADANGATSSAALTITITGTNDAPVAVADSNAGDRWSRAASTRATRRSPATRRRPATC